MDTTAAGSNVDDDNDMVDAGPAGPARPRNGIDGRAWGAGPSRRRRSHWTDPVPPARLLSATRWHGLCDAVTAASARTVRGARGAGRGRARGAGVQAGHPGDVAAPVSAAVGAGVRGRGRGRGAAGAGGRGNRGSGGVGRGSRARPSVLDVADDDDDDDDQGDATEVHAVDHDADLAAIDLGDHDAAQAPLDDLAGAVSARTTAPDALGRRLLLARKAAAAAAVREHRLGFATAAARRDAAWARERDAQPAGWKPQHGRTLPDPIQGTTARTWLARRGPGPGSPGRPLIVPTCDSPRNVSSWAHRTSRDVPGPQGALSPWRRSRPQRGHRPERHRRRYQRRQSGRKRVPVLRGHRQGETGSVGKAASVGGWPICQHPANLPRRCQPCLGAPWRRHRSNHRDPHSADAAAEVLRLGKVRKSASQSTGPPRSNALLPRSRVHGLRCL